jgi:hypothetical protein
MLGRMAKGAKVGGVGQSWCPRLDHARLRSSFALGVASKDHLDKPWASLIDKPERAVQAMLDASVTVEIGNGRRALFWQDRWLDGRSLLQLAPDMVAAIPKCTYSCPQSCC